MSGALPPKALAALIKAIARHTLLKDVFITLEELQASLLGGLSPAAAAELVREIQGGLAVAAHGNWSPEQLHSFLSEGSLKADQAEAVVSYWSEAKQGIQAAIASRAGAGRPTLEDVSFRVATHTASTDTATGAAGEAEPRAVVDLRLRPADAGATAAAITASASKAMLSDMLASLGQLRRELDRAAAATA